MEQVAHQTIVMQFILELAKSLKVDPRGCFRQFFEKIKVKNYEPSKDSNSSCSQSCFHSVLIRRAMQISSVPLLQHIYLYQTFLDSHDSCF